MNLEQKSDEAIAAMGLLGNEKIQYAVEPVVWLDGSFCVVFGLFNKAGVGAVFRTTCSNLVEQAEAVTYLESKFSSLGYSRNIASLTSRSPQLPAQW